MPSGSISSFWFQKECILLLASHNASFLLSRTQDQEIFFTNSPRINTCYSISPRYVLFENKTEPSCNLTSHKSSANSDSRKCECNTVKACRLERLWSTENERRRKNQREENPSYFSLEGHSLQYGSLHLRHHPEFALQFRVLNSDFTLRLWIDWIPSSSE